MSLIWSIIWIQENHRKNSSSNNMDIKVDWQSSGIDKPLSAKNQSHVLKLQEHSNDLLRDYRQSLKLKTPWRPQKIKKEKKGARPKSSIREFNLHQPISHKKSLSPPFEKAKIALVLHGMGLDPEKTRKAIHELTSAITLTFIPYGASVESFILEAQKKEHEVLMAIPMESMAYPQDDPGPQVLLTGVSSHQNKKRLQWVLDKAKGCLGVCNDFGSRFTAIRKDLKPVLEEIHAQGFLFLDTKATNRSQVETISHTIHLPHGISDIRVDIQESYSTFVDKLGDLIEIALEQGQAIGVIEMSPHRLEHLIEWQNSLGKNDSFQLVPLSHVTVYPPRPQSFPKEKKLTLVHKQSNKNNHAPQSS